MIAGVTDHPTTRLPTPDADRFGSRTGEFALIVAGTVVLGLLFPGAGLLGVSAARFSGVRARPGRMRALLVVALVLVPVRVAMLWFAFHPLVLCGSTAGDASHCVTIG